MSMTIDEAKEINSEVYSWCVGFAVGAPTPNPPPNYPLCDMLEASRMMHGYTEPAADETGVEGARRCHATVDDRMIAAMYVLGNYDGDPSDEAEPILIGNGKAVVVVEFGGDVFFSDLVEREDD